jgi:hypothetical protein
MTRIVAVLLLLLLAVPLPAASQAPLPAAVPAEPPCSASVVLRHCGDPIKPGHDQPFDNGRFDLGRVVVTAPIQRKATPGETFARVFALPPSKDSLITPSQRDDRDGFGLRTECQYLPLTCRNQPGRPQTSDSHH